MQSSLPPFDIENGYGRVTRIKAAYCKLRPMQHKTRIAGIECAIAKDILYLVRVSALGLQATTFSIRNRI